MTKGAIENFWIRFDITVKTRGYNSLREFVEDIDIGISYPTLLTKRCRKMLPELHTLLRISDELDVSLDYLLFGYDRDNKRFTSEETAMMHRYQSASTEEKTAIRAILGL